MKPLKIVFVNMMYDYGDTARGYSLEMLFYDELHAMGHRLIPFHYDILLRQYSKREVNDMLLKLVHDEQADVLFTILFQDHIDKETFGEITNNTSTVTFNWCADDHWRFDSYTSQWAPYFNWMVTTSEAAVPKYHDMGYENIILSQWGCNSGIHRKVPAGKLYDVSFVGAITHIERGPMLQRVRDAGFALYCWGAGTANGRLSLENTIGVFNQTKINLNFSQVSSANLLQIKARDFEVPGSGGFLLTGYNEELKTYYEFGKEIETYQNADEMIEKIHYYLAHDEEREKIAAAGYKRAHDEHTYKHRFEHIFAKMGL